MSDLKRVHNFNPGPGVLPLEVLQEAQAELLNFNGTGMSVMEISHRSKEFEAVIQTAEADLRELLGIPSNYKVMFLQGGATLQFTMEPMNLRPAGASADYVVTGAWSKIALKEAQKLGAARAAANTEADGFNCLPKSLDLDPKAAYLHFTSNETIHGVEFFEEPTPPDGVPLFCDTSSDFISRPIDVSKYGLLYAGAQKNAGPSGVTVVIIREDMLARVPENLPVMLDYKILAESGSLHNTPPSFSIYMVGLVFKWAKKLGGLAAVEKINREKAGIVYKAIDESGGFYRGHTVPEARSLMNIPFRLPNEALEETFAKEAKNAGLIGLKGHRSVGGMRASVYNAMTIEGAKELGRFMQEFQRRNG
ncbi:MAG: 3-phosphoserine/phosphohydroxythreonine transaminase [Chloroflexi bacterium CFX1]|nr:3-phosphoserine/phosphohydroxythreonine transaminase [Chloroflexi bacterium CFX1]MCQ3953352.1 3-phosphoserine/phosphohydroxythreonine transaminase [Chloroflexota bacterium]MDL1920708.1 3-phosphoserine/phosphohydroxythreonine transaminase [Chloroflexi bacterium CFX5]NUQ60536.1 3-phosphoserine/phosphohydroxythreonine transaminase [Anaerolineales bacterium]